MTKVRYWNTQLVEFDTVTEKTVIISSFSKPVKDTGGTKKKKTTVKYTDSGEAEVETR